MMRTFISLLLAGLTLFGAAAYIPNGTGEPQPGPIPFSCALRVAPDGSLQYSPVDFPPPAIPADAPKVNTGRSPYCDIINSSGRAIPYETVRSLDENFTLYIWPNDTAAFGTPRYAKIKLYIITYDGMGGVAGYFSSGTPDSIFLDYDDLSLDLDVTAHEFQHLIHNDKDPYETIWLNEGCSETGIYVCYGGANPGLTLHFGGYNTNTDNDFTNWDTVSDYGGAGLWTIYNYEHFGRNNFTRALVADQTRGMNSYNNQLASKGESFNSVFQKWVVANWLNNHTVDSGEWGYSGVWNWVGHNLLEKNYPATCSTSVHQAWSANYIRFEPTVWNKYQGDLQINVTFTSGTPYCGVAAAGKLNSGISDLVVIPTISGNRATALVPNLGGDFAVACLVVSGMGGGCSYTFEANIVDLTPPNTSLTITPPKPNGKNGWYVSRPSVGLATNEMNCTMFYRWDDGADVKLPGKIEVPEGTHVLQYHSVDKAGNVETERSRTFKVDLTPPNTSAIMGPPAPDGANGWYRTAPNISLSSDTPGANLTWSWDEGPFAVYNSSVQMKEGIHRFNFRGEDQAGNFEIVKTVETKLDTELPIVQPALRPAVPDGLNGWYIKTPFLNLSCIDPHHPVMYYRWDNGTENVYKGDLRPAYGAHTLTSRAVDDAGNRGPESSLLVKVDPIAPGVNVSSEGQAPDGTDGWYKTPLWLNFTPNESGNVTVYCRWDNDTSAPVDGPLEVPEGVHTLHYYAVDEAGNKGREKSLPFKLDLVPPTTEMAIGPEDAGKGWFHVHPTITLSTEADAVMHYTLDDGPVMKYLKPFEIGEGVHSLTFYATDRAGNNETPRNRSFRVDTLAPTLKVALSSVNITTRENVTITATSEDATGVQDYLFDFGDGTASTWTSSSSVSHGYALPGPYTIKVRVRDSSGLMTVSAPLSITVKAPPKPPVASPAEGLAQFLGSLPAYVFYLMGLLVVLGVVGAAASHVARKRRRARLYIEVEKAEQERERRHTMEIHDDDPLGLPRSSPPFHPSQPSYGGFRGGAAPPSGQYHPAGHPQGHAVNPHSAYATAPVIPVTQQSHEGARISWQPSGSEEADETRPDFGNVKVIERKDDEEVVYQAEVGAAAPVWASSGKKKTPSSAAATHNAASTHQAPQVAQARQAQQVPQPQHAPTPAPARSGKPPVIVTPGGRHHQHSTGPARKDAAEPDIQSILKHIEDVKRQ